jgi:SAM-dependent methyltransferase
MSETNPWLAITAADYEDHMGPQGADQTAPLSAVFGQVYRAVRPRRLALLGCATGNGLEHVDPGLTQRTVGVDLNIQYVAVARQRLVGLGARLELYCGDVLTMALEPESFDLVHAALLFEYVHPLALVPRIAGWLAPGGVCSTVLQLPAESGPISPSPHSSIHRLSDIMKLVPPSEMAATFARHGIQRTGTWEVPVKGGKRFHVALFRRPDDP